MYQPSSKTSTHNRRSIRLPGYDYSQDGAYFVTLVTAGRESIFGAVSGGEMKLSKIGKIAYYEWMDIPRHFPLVVLGEYTIMPNHIHGIIIIQERVSRPSVVGATLPCTSRIISSEGNLSNKIPVGINGSPLRPSTSRIISNEGNLSNDNPVGINGSPLQPCPERIISNEDNLPIEIPVGIDGSPRPSIVGATPSFPVRNISDNDTLPIEVPVGIAGSPLRESSTQPNGPAPESIGAIIGQFKSRVTKRIWSKFSNKGTSVWQRNYFEHIIRDEEDYTRIAQYIAANPLNWEKDEENL